MSVRENGALTRDQTFPSQTSKLLTLDHHHYDQDQCLLFSHVIYILELV